MDKNNNKKRLYIIVGEDAVKSYADMGKALYNSRNFAQEVLDNIQDIKNNNDFLEIKDNEFVDILHPGIPDPNDDLEILVAGGYTYTGVAYQLFSLKSAGYNASYAGRNLCFDGAISTIMQSYLNDFPDFYDGLEKDIV